MDPIIGKGLDKVIDGAAEGPIKTLNLTWDLVFGKYHNWIRKIQVKREIDFNEFKESINSKLTTIPHENLKEPEISLLGPAIEASKFYIAEKDIRNLFTNLITSSMDNRKSKDIHHSFVEIIKQLSSNDAILFEELSARDVIPAVRYVAVLNKNLGTLKLSDVVIEKSPLNFRDTEISLVNLQRVGLIEIDIGIHSYTKEELYSEFNKPYMSINFIQRYKEQRQKEYSNIFSLIHNFGVEEIAKNNNLSVDEIFNHCKPASIEYKKGMISITSFGKAFINCCLA